MTWCRMSPGKRRRPPSKRAPLAKLPAKGNTARLPPVGVPTIDDHISRGPAGGCCLRCGKVGIELPVEHGCIPDVGPGPIRCPQCGRALTTYRPCVGPHVLTGGPDPVIDWDPPVMIDWADLWAR